jgi:hypothetical protein
MAGIGNHSKSYRDIQGVQISTYPRAGIDPTSPFTVEGANVGNQIAKQPLPHDAIIMHCSNWIISPLPETEADEGKRRPDLVFL